MNLDEGTGGTVIKCSHYSHYKCLNNFLTLNQADHRKAEFRKLIGLDLQTFQCPLCKHISNGLIPYDSLRNFDQNKYDYKDFDMFSLVEAYTRFISRILQSQDLKKTDTLPVDIKINPLESLKAV